MFETRRSRAGPNEADIASVPVGEASQTWCWGKYGRNLSRSLVSAWHFDKALRLIQRPHPIIRLVRLTVGKNRATRTHGLLWVGGPDLGSSAVSGFRSGTELNQAVVQEEAYRSPYATKEVHRRCWNTMDLYRTNYEAREREWSCERERQQAYNGARDEKSGKSIKAPRERAVA